MANLLHCPVSIAAHRLTEDLLEITLAGEATHLGLRQRQRNQSATESLKATIAALAHDLLKAASHAASQGYCFRPERSPNFTRTLAAFRQYQVACPHRVVWLQS
jgi:hypothetical protein